MCNKNKLVLYSHLVLNEILPSSNQTLFFLYILLIKMFSSVSDALLTLAKIALRNQRNLTQIGILGVPFSKGQYKPGTEKGPKAIRDRGLIDRLKSINDDINVKDYGDVVYKLDDDILDVHNMTNYKHLPPCMRAISTNVAKIINDKRMCITLGGDHSIGIGTIDGHLQAKVGNVAVLWVDAHADINTPHTSETGNIHGMPVSVLCRELQAYQPELPGMEWQTPELSVANVAYIGLRSVDPYERLIIEQLNMAAYGMDEVQRYGIKKVIEMALERIDAEKKRSIHISFDIDSLDVHEAPSTGVPVRGGLTLREGVYIVEKVLETGRLGAIDLVEVNPTIGSAKDVDVTVESAINILMAATGHQRSGLITRSLKNIPVPKVPRFKNPMRSTV